MTERLTIEQARALGYLGEPDKLPKATTAPVDAKRAAAEAGRLRALLKLIEALLADGHDLRLEYRFHPRRRWRFDVALLDQQLALEIDGGGWVQGAHHRKAGRDRDNERDSEAQRLGWRVVRRSWEHVLSGEALATVRGMTGRG